MQPTPPGACANTFVVQGYLRLDSTRDWSIFIRKAVPSLAFLTGFLLGKENRSTLRGIFLRGVAREQGTAKHRPLRRAHFPPSRRSLPVVGEPRAARSNGRRHHEEHPEVAEPYRDPHPYAQRGDPAGTRYPSRTVPVFRLLSGALAQSNLSGVHCLGGWELSRDRRPSRGLGKARKP